MLGRQVFWLAADRGSLIGHLPSHSTRLPARSWSHSRAGPTQQIESQFLSGLIIEADINIELSSRHLQPLVVHTYNNITLPQSCLTQLEAKGPGAPSPVSDSKPKRCFCSVERSSPWTDGAGQVSWSTTPR